MSAKNPVRPSGPLRIDASDLTDHVAPLWRIHRTTGPYRQKWDQMRTAGPLRSARWDPHPSPANSTTSVYYAAPDVAMAFAEVFHSRRRIILSQHQALVGWKPIRVVRLLDLTVPSDPEQVSWPLRNGASASLDSAPRSTCRNWAQAIHAARPDLDGLSVRSTVVGRPMVVLFTPAGSAFPPGPALARKLDDPALAITVQSVATTLGWPVIQS